MRLSVFTAYTKRAYNICAIVVSASVEQIEILVNGVLGRPQSPILA
jgi:hypothetical protein